MREVPERFRRFGGRHPEVAEAYEKLAAACRQAGPLDERSQALVRLGVAVGAQVEGAVRSQVRKALDLGLTPGEVRHAMLLSLPSIGCPRMMAALGWAEDLLDAPGGGGKGEA
ncbi:MAG: carboxymuconolactone decarboxylase family protein [Acidobacteriota bacterium]|nr:carboxymuconolactone decarboxylase family protein [Acidobacteriota bacterium]